MDENLKNFLEAYESKMKFIRRLYKRDLYNNNGNDYDYILITIFGVLSIIFSAIVLFILDFTMIGYVIALITLIILSLVYCYFSIKLMDSKARYLYAVKKRGYNSIDEYEEDLKLFLTGPGAYYSTILDDLKLQYKVNESVDKVIDIYDEEYYVWVDDGALFVLSNSTEYRPKVRVYELTNVRYYRVDINNNYLVLKTNSDEYQLTMDSLSTIKKLLPKKDFKSVKNYHPEDYINDYEIFMHSFKKDIEDKNENFREYLINSLILVVSFLVVFILLGILNSVLSSFSLFIKLLSIVILALLFNKIKKLIRYRALIYDVSDVIYEINTDSDVANHFNELKIALDIKSDYDTIISTGGYPYVIWVSKGYLHLFLDVPYYNVVYIVLGLKNDIKYKIKNGEAVLKLKDKTFKFEKNAITVFDKLLSKKDSNK